ncbi:hypothetical protein PR048_033605 [Dryococelus australis]|uniref:Uncharacterized protein n=1 Tax=Dryococelus australis TaxID=614101 RepID=A0ABQ9G3K8_9NEOP|nr:hypothetical protein PR048_033605 [Dryococelus australis]
MCRSFTEFVLRHPSFRASAVSNMGCTVISARYDNSDKDFTHIWAVHYLQVRAPRYAPIAYNLSLSRPRRSLTGRCQQTHGDDEPRGGKGGPEGAIYSPFTVKCNGLPRAVKDSLIAGSASVTRAGWQTVLRLRYDLAGVCSWSSAVSHVDTLEIWEVPVTIQSSMKVHKSHSRLLTIKRRDGTIRLFPRVLETWRTNFPQCGRDRDNRSFQLQSWHSTKGWSLNGRGWDSVDIKDMKKLWKEVTGNLKGYHEVMNKSLVADFLPGRSVLQVAPLKITGDQEAVCCDWLHYISLGMSESLTLRELPYPWIQQRRGVSAGVVGLFAAQVRSLSATSRVPKWRIVDSQVLGWLGIIKYQLADQEAGSTEPSSWASGTWVAQLKMAVARRLEGAQYRAGRNPEVLKQCEAWRTGFCGLSTADVCGSELKSTKP